MPSRSHRCSIISEGDNHPSPHIMYKIVEKYDHSAVHSIGYINKEKAQSRIDSGECLRYWTNKEAEFEVIEDYK